MIEREPYEVHEEHDRQVECISAELVRIANRELERRKSQT